MSQVLAGPRYRGLRMDADQYAQLEADGYRYELIDGVVHMSPSATPEHQKIAAEVLIQIGIYLRSNSIGVVMAEVDVHLTRGLVYRPDVVVLLGAKADQAVNRVRGAPDIVVEVVSPDSRAMDVETKMQDYERFGVGEYWVIDPHRDAFAFFRRQGDQFIELAQTAAQFTSTVLPGFGLDLNLVRRLF